VGLELAASGTIAHELNLARHLLDIHVVLDLVPVGLFGLVLLPWEKVIYLRIHFYYYMFIIFLTSIT
jgi:hypothetical protein